MSNSLQQGDKLKAIFWSGESCITVGERGCISITIVENGQMSNIPWAEVKYDNGRIIRYNLAMCEGVELDCEASNDQ